MSKINFWLPFKLPQYLCEKITKEAKKYQIRSEFSIAPGETVFTFTMEEITLWQPFVSRLNTDPLRLPPSLFDGRFIHDVDDLKVTKRKKVIRDNKICERTLPGI